MDKLMKQALEQNKIIRYIPTFIKVMETYKKLLEEHNEAFRQCNVSGWRMFTVELTLNNGLKTKYISSMEGIDEVKAKEIAIKQDWISGVKSVDSVSFDACR